MKNVILLSIFTAVTLFGFFTYNYANYSKAALIDIDTQSKVYQEMLNKQLKEKLEKERISDEKKTLRQIYVSLRVSNIKIDKEENLEECSTLWDPLEKVPDPVYVENQLEKEKVSTLYLDIRKKCVRLRIAEIKRKQEIALQTQEELSKKVNQEIYSRIPTYQQGRNTNTCVIDNLSLLTEFEYWKRLDKKRIYEKIGKKSGQFWYSGLFAINQYGGTFSPVKENTLWFDKDTETIFYLSEKEKHKNWELVEERRDWEKLEEQTGLKTGLSPSIWYLIEVLNTKKPVLMELPMSVLYPEDPKWANSSIYHAISVFQYNKDTNELIYSNTLTNKIETISLDKVKYNETYLKYPFRYVTFFESNNYTFFE